MMFSKAWSAGLFIGLMSVQAGSAFAAEPDLPAILLDSDKARGGSIEGVRWTVIVKQFEGGEAKDEIQVDVRAASAEEHLYALVSFEKPTKYRGRKLLLRDHNMWFVKEGLRKPVPISTRQRLSGSASNADIASANYYYDYKPKLLRTEDLNGESCYVLELEAKSDLVTYPRIEYWVTTAGHLGKKAKFFGSSGKQIKEATFEYANQLTIAGSPAKPFVSKVSISDQINVADRTELILTEVVLGEHKRSLFQVESL